MNEKMEKALNEQINRELYSAYLYLAIAAYFDANNYRGAAHWTKMQAAEEMVHVTKMYNFVFDRDGRAVMGAIDCPPKDWKSLEDAFTEILAHERKITGNIHDLVSMATEERDHAANSFLQWFVNEQVEEEASVKEILDQIKLIGNAPGGIYMLDKELASRVAPVNPLGTTGV